MAAIMGQQSVQLTVRERTKMGRRKSNQDAALLVEVVPGRVFLAGVADGMGGYAGGEQASAAAKRHVLRFAESLHFEESTSDRDILRYIRSCMHRLYDEIQQEIQELSQSDSNLSQMGTTMVLAAVSGRQFFVANIGDSRAYFLYKNSSGEDAFRQVTEDHTVVNDARRANQPLTLDTPEAQKLGKALTKALRPNTPSTPEIWPPDVDSVAYQAADGCVLLICSDGMYGSVEENEIAQILIESPTLDASLERLEDRAYANESTDNITTVAVDFGPRDPRRRSTIRPLAPAAVPVRAADIVGVPAPAAATMGAVSSDGPMGAGSTVSRTPKSETQRESNARLNPFMLIGGAVFAIGAAIAGFIVFGPKPKPNPTPTPTASAMEVPSPVETATPKPLVVKHPIKPVASPTPEENNAATPENNSRSIRIDREKPAKPRGEGSENSTISRSAKPPKPLTTKPSVKRVPTPPSVSEIRRNSGNDLDTPPKDETAKPNPEPSKHRDTPAPDEKKKDEKKKGDGVDRAIKDLERKP